MPTIVKGWLTVDGLLGCNKFIVVATQVEENARWIS